MNRNRRGFTLIELLVIANFTLLISKLLVARGLAKLGGTLVR